MYLCSKCFPSRRSGGFHGRAGVPGAAQPVAVPVAVTAAPLPSPAGRGLGTSLPGPAAATPPGHGPTLPAAPLLCREKARLGSPPGTGCAELWLFCAPLKIRCWVISNIYIHIKNYVVALNFLHESHLFQEKKQTNG